MIKLDADQYRINVNAIEQHLKDKDDVDRLESVSKLAIMTGVPIVIVAVYIKELYPDLPGINGKLLRLMDFYDVNEVLNRKD